MHFSSWVITFILVSLFILGMCSAPSSQNPNIIDWDGYGYYVYLPRIFIYPGDREYGFAEMHGEKYPKSYLDYQLLTIDEHSKRSVYNIGLAVLWLPFFLIAHIITVCFTSLPADGMSLLYQWAVYLSSFFYLLIGMVYLRRWLRPYVSDKYIALCLLLLVYGTNFYYYFQYGKPLTHLYLWGALAVYAYYCDLSLRTKRAKYALITGLLLGLAVVIRSSEVFWIIMPLTLGLSLRQLTSGSEWKYRTRLVGQLVVMAFLVYFGTQMLFDYLTTGHWWIDGYKEHSFDLLHPYLYEQSIGPSRGWLTYTPLLIFMLGGMSLKSFYKSAWKLSLPVFLLCYFYLICSWDDWTFGSTFGNRPMIQTFAVLCLPLALSLSKIAGSIRSIKWVAITAIVYFILQNLVQTYQFNKSILPRFIINYSFYQRVYMKTKLDMHDRILISLPHGLDLLPDDHYDSASTLATEVPIAPLSQSGSDYHALHEEETTETSQLGLAPLRLKVSADISYLGSAYSFYISPLLIFELRHQDSIYCWDYINLPESMNQSRDLLVYNLEIPQRSSGDKLRVFITNKTEDSLYVHSLQIARSQK